jgi:branched chain amino acid efflux pump
MYNTPREAYYSGVKTISPMLMGVIPFGTIAGVTAVSAGIAPLPAIAMSMIVFAGAAQLAVADLMAKNAPALVILFTALIINFRFMMYSASLAPHFNHLENRWKWPLAYLMTDQGYAISIMKFSQAPDLRHKHWFYLGCGSTIWLTWQVSTAVGVFLGLQVPQSWSLDFAIPLTFMALLIPASKDLAAIAAALVAGSVSVAGLQFPLNIGIIVAVVCGISAGAIVEWLHKGSGDDAN